MATVNEVEMAEKLVSETKRIPLSSIQKSEVALRDVQRNTEDYQQLVESVRNKGVLNSILVKKTVHPSGITQYILIDGLQRYNASLDAGLTDIPANIVDMDDGEVLEAQIITNVRRIKTKPAELSSHLRRLLARNPSWTKSDLAEKLSASTTWIDQRLSLQKLLPEIQEKVDSEDISLTNAVALSELPEEEQMQHVQAAMSEAHNTFVPRIKDRVKELRAAARKGKDAEEYKWTPSMSVRKRSEIVDEFNALQNGDESTITNLLARDSITDPVEVARYAVSWVLNYDKDSQEAQRQKHEAQVKAREEERERRKAEKEKMKEQKAAQEAADISKGF